MMYSNGDPMPKLKHKLGHTYYELHGAKSSGVPLVCLHGGPGGTHHYFQPLRALARTRPVLFYDQVGAGRSSEIPRKQQTWSTLVEDLDRLLKHLKIERCHILGTSCGGTLAIEYHRHVKGRGIASLVMQSPFISSKVWARDANRLLETLSKKQQRVIKACIEVGATDSKVYQEAEAAYYAKYVFRGKLDAASIAYRKKYPNPHGRALYQHMWGPSEFSATGTLRTYERESLLRKITCPTLYICGQYDEATPEAMKRFARQTPDSRVVVIKGASHSLVREKPREFIRELREFLVD